VGTTQILSVKRFIRYDNISYDNFDCTTGNHNAQLQFPPDMEAIDIDQDLALYMVSSGFDVRVNNSEQLLN
jgi:hypothetical protein